MGYSTTDPTRSGNAATGEAAAEPILRVVRGDPTPEELAALVAVLTARAVAESPPVPVSDAPGWGVVRPRLHPGPGAWRASALVPGTRTRAGW